MANPVAPRALGTATRLLVAALMLGAVALVVRQRAARAEAGLSELTELMELMGLEPGQPCRPAPACGPQLYDDLPDPPVIAHEEACRDAAYLCVGLAVRGEPLRALRWNEKRPALQIRLGWPNEVPASAVAARHQRAAERGLRAWAGLPLDILVQSEREPVAPRRPERPRLVRGADGWGEDVDVVVSEPLVKPTYRDRRPEVHDFAVHWRITPQDTELGETRTIWGSDGLRGGYGTRVSFFALSRMREVRGTVLTDLEVQAAAAHAMGHVLGLPHSPSPADVMYPGNTAVLPSEDDRKAIAALYALPNGAEIGPAASGKRR